MDIYEIRLRNLSRLIDTEFRGRKGDFAKKINREPSYISRFFSQNTEQKKNLGHNLAREIERAINKPEGWLDTVREQADQTAKPAETEKTGLITQTITPAEKKLIDEFVLIPKYDVKASMGHGQIVPSEDVVDMLAFKRNWVHTELGINPKNLVLITAVGDSMEPALRPGDLILIDRSVDQVMTDAIYVVSFNGELLAKRIQRLFDGSLEIISDNPAYKTQVLSSEQAEQLRVVGRVVWAGRRM